MAFSFHVWNPWCSKSREIRFIIVNYGWNNFRGKLVNSFSEGNAKLIRRIGILDWSFLRKRRYYLIRNRVGFNFLVIIKFVYYKYGNCLGWYIKLISNNILMWFFGARSDNVKLIRNSILNRIFWCEEW